MRKGPLAAIGATLLAVFVFSSVVRADSLDQVPSDALVVLKIKNLDGFSGKVAGWAKTIGIDQQDPAWADPLGAFADKTHLGKGVKRDGDLAIAMLDPGEGGNEDKSVIAVVPITNYKTFLSNFKATADEGGDITKATPHDGDKDVYVVNWGQYAALSPMKAIVSKKPAGLKLTGFSAKESDSKDVLLYANIKALKAKLDPHVKDGRQQAINGLEQALGGNEMAKPYIPLAKAVVNQIMNAAEEFLNDSTGATVGLVITENGPTLTFASDFEPTTYIGKLALATKGTSASLLNGLPARKYFLFGGSSADPAVSKKLFADMLDPIIKELGTIQNLKKFADALEASKVASGTATGYTFGLVAPTAALGQESVIQQIAITRGDSKSLQDAQRKMLAATNDLMQLIPQQNGMKTSFEFKQGAKTVGEVAFDQFESKITFPEDDAQAQQAKQMLTFIYGPAGMSGVIGSLDGKTLLAVQGGTDELISDAVKSAKADADNLGATAGVRAVAAEMPKMRSGAVYFDAGTFVSTVLRYAKGFGALPVNVKIPADLPPIGFTTGAEGTAFRVDVHIPNRLVQAFVAAYADAQRQQRNPNGGLQ